MVGILMAIVVLPMGKMGKLLQLQLAVLHRVRAVEQHAVIVQLQLRSVFSITNR
jgi:hypothetical protein